MKITNLPKNIYRVSAQNYSTTYWTTRNEARTARRDATASGITDIEIDQFPVYRPTTTS